MTALPQPIADLKADFDLIDQWEDRYRYVMDLGRALPDLPVTLKTEANKVRGCASQVWLISSTVPRPNGTIMHFQGDSDAHIVRGLVAILLMIYQDRTAADVASIDALALFAELGLKDQLTPQRANGLASMVQRIRRDAQAAQVA